MRPAPLALLTVLALAAGPTAAGHEPSIYPSYYPQEIRVEAVEPAAAAALLEKNGLHAYIGGDPFAGAPVPAHVKPVESLGSYLVLTFNPASGPWRDREARCAAVRTLAQTLPPPGGAYVAHPYPVTPYHADYLHHLDRALGAKRAYETPPPPSAARPSLRLRVAGPLARRLVPGSGQADPWDATLEEIDAGDLVAQRRISLNGWLGPPWMKEGWFHAYLLHAGAVTDGATKSIIDATVRGLMTGGYGGVADRLNLERKLVALLVGGCQRAVLGYTVKREYFNAEFSDGIENVAADAHAGLNSPIFVRTVKLKDFLWNGWLRLGAAARPSAAWNPISGFTDAPGRLIWAAVGDPASFPAPQGASWIGNRVISPSVTPESEVPKDALLPEAGTGSLREVGPGKTAKVKIVYKVLASAFHDDSRMAVADILYPFSFVYRWGATTSRGQTEHDPAIEAAAAGIVDWLTGLKVVGVDANVREVAEVKFTSVVQTVEVFGRFALADPQESAAIAPPWSPIPWNLLALMEEAVKRRVAAFSPDEARRLRVPWLDLAREQTIKDTLAALVDEFVRQGYVPTTLAGLVTAGEARERWAALQRFYRKHGHFLVTNGPYRLDTWSADGAVLAVFRDFTYPLGLGSYDRYPIPVRAFITRVEPRGDRLEIHADVETVQKFQREYAIVRQSLDSAGPDLTERPVCRYVVVNADGEVVQTGVAAYAGADVFALDLTRALKPGSYAVAVAVHIGQNYVNPEARLVEHRVGAGP